MTRSCVRRQASNFINAIVCTDGLRLPVSQRQTVMRAFVPPKPSWAAKSSAESLSRKRRLRIWRGVIPIRSREVFFFDGAMPFAPPHSEAFTFSLDACSTLWATCHDTPI